MIIVMVMAMTMVIVWYSNYNSDGIGMRMGTINAMYIGVQLY